ncbi:metallophosphoesterase [Pseudomonas amygdali pv. aesculi str. 0893_23]|uniref:Metallophosphoesterase n=1 Tax=Pseudomonas serbiensis TaxID=3064350 RepID=A0ABT9CU98_9PSED|nr:MULTISPECIES: metallophosphoesterase [Pseudomonas]EGH04651.1 metallophosphoesterase [Pseudomonas amygdali pv. aesculi str. 0893_23]KPW23277.1 hypothetical protein ALO90_200181 [Pseudomonas amygdali pv. aesculi]MCQ3013709.1 metallophosphoesterase [Pseudomonas savastanoi]MDO7929063.1 metallophosphoesterase [Pseudomonas sp. KFB-138]
MKIRVLSDLHLEFEPYAPVDVEADLVVLAGDIHTKNRGVEWANQMFNCPVIHILGNHELYAGHLDRTLEKMRLQAAPHVHILECETFIANGVRFLCATAWTDFTSTGNLAVASSVAKHEMNDFRMIRCGQGYRRIRPDDLIAKNRATRAWLDDELNRPFGGKTIVVTHHAPIPQVIGYKHDGHLNAAYANAWHELVPLADAWIFGHTHLAVDVVMGGCRLVSNPKGYPQEDTGFDPWKLIEI